MFFRIVRDELTIMLVYVDDILLVKSNDKFRDKLVLALNKKFSLKFLNDGHYFLHFEIYRTLSTLQLNQ